MIDFLVCLAIVAHLALYAWGAWQIVTNRGRA